ncbi:MAG: DNA-binding protein [Pseudomonadota bacterium]
MARGVTQEQVNTVIEQLLLAGERPTIERVRATLGTGSPNTLTRMLDVWWQALGERLAEQRRSVAIPDAPAAVVGAASALWEAALATAHEMAEKRVEQTRETLAMEGLAMERVRNEMATALTAAQQAQVRAERGQRETEARLGDLQRLVDQQTGQVADLQTRLSAAEGQVTTLAAQLQRAEAARTQVQEQSTMERRDLEASHRAAEDRWLSEVDQLRQERARLNRELAASGKKARDALQGSEARLADMAGKLSGLESREAAAVARAAALESQLERMHDQLRMRLSAAKPTRRRQPKSKKEAT